MRGPKDKNDRWRLARVVVGLYCVLTALAKLEAEVRVVHACRAAESLYCALAGGQNRALAKPGVSEAGVIVYGFAGWPDAALLAVCLML